MLLFGEFLDYIKDILQNVADLISDSWLLSALFWLHVIYLIVIAVKLKKKTD